MVHRKWAIPPPQYPLPSRRKKAPKSAAKKLLKAVGKKTGAGKRAKKLLKAPAKKRR